MRIFLILCSAVLMMGFLPPAYADLSSDCSSELGSATRGEIVPFPIKRIVRQPVDRLSTEHQSWTYSQAPHQTSLMPAKPGSIWLPYGRTSMSDEKYVEAPVQADDSPVVYSSQYLVQLVFTRANDPIEQEFDCATVIHHLAQWSHLDEAIVSAACRTFEGQQRQNHFKLEAKHLGYYLNAEFLKHGRRLLLFAENGRVAL